MFPAYLQQVTWNALDDGRGKPIPGGLYFPTPMIFGQLLPMNFVIADNCLHIYIRELFTKFRYSLLVYKNSFLEILQCTDGNKLSQLIYLTPYRKCWSSDSLQIMKWLLGDLIVIRMKLSSNYSFFLLLAYNNRSFEMRLMTGGRQPIPSDLYYPLPCFCSSHCQCIF